MKIASLYLILSLYPTLAFAQYDYNDDFTKSVNAHYPPLVRLLITKGANQNTQDINGDTPLILAIRTHDREITDLLSHYQPDYSLQNNKHHSAAIEAVIADDSDSLAMTLVRDDMLQVAQVSALARKLKKRRSYNKLSEILGAAGAEEISTFSLENILPYFNIGNAVSITYSPPDEIPMICGKKTTTFLFQGKICNIAGENITIEWHSVSNLNNYDTKCSSQHHFRIRKSENIEKNITYLGSCSKAPLLFPQLPTTFNYKQLLIPELKK